MLITSSVMESWADCISDLPSGCRDLFIGCRVGCSRVAKKVSRKSLYSKSQPAHEITIAVDGKRCIHRYMKSNCIQVGSLVAQIIMYN